MESPDMRRASSASITSISEAKGYIQDFLQDQFGGEKKKNGVGKFGNIHMWNSWIQFQMLNEILASLLVWF
jgi:hypothetical protein